MKSDGQETPVVVIVGPTASGKTGLAISVAVRYGGEVICADSRTIYRGMDIGTAKPTTDEQRGVPHYGLDILDPDETYSASLFKQMAKEKVSEIADRGRLPIIAGGSGLYIWALLYDYVFPADADNEYRRHLEQKPLDMLVTDLKQLDPEAFGEVDLKNKRRVIRAIETAGQAKTRSVSLPENYILVGICPPFELLEQRIQHRTKGMIEQGLIGETQKLVEQYGPNTESLQSVGYKEAIEYLNNTRGLEETEAIISLHTRQLAKRQMTWFKRNKDIQWVETSEQAEQIIKVKLQTFGTMDV